MKNTLLNDALFPFIFDNMPIRGNLVHLNDTFTQALQHQQLPTNLKTALGELMAASILLTSSIKLDGALILQLQAKGALKLLVVECTSDLKIRATATWDTDQTELVQNSQLIDLIVNGHFMITLDPSVGEAYQGIVPIEGDTIADMLQNYMLRSQQIDTTIILDCDGASAAGLLLQKLPNSPESDIDAWNRINHLANTVTPDELQLLAADTLLKRLFSEEDVRLFSAQPTQFFCSCTHTNVANMLKMLGQVEIDDILADFGKIDVNCDFCNKHYAFDALDASQLFNEKAVYIDNNTTH